MLLGLRSNDIDVFEASGAIEPQIAQVFPEKTEAFAEQENGDQSEDHNRDDRIATEKVLNRSFDQAPAALAMTPRERACAFVEWAESHPDTPPLSDEAISRESIYATRG